MSFDPYYTMMSSQRERTRAEVLWADAQAVEIAVWIWGLGRSAAQAARILRHAASFGATLQLRRTR